MAAKDPDALRFKLWQSPKAKQHPDKLGTHELTAVHPSKGPVGTLQYVKRADHLQVETLRVHPDHRGNGYAGHLMDEMQRRHPATPINHGSRTGDGQDWWDKYSEGKDVVDGRTMASRTASIPQHQSELLSTPDSDEGKRGRLLDLARNPKPGTHIWRGEVRHKDDLAAPASVGMHWSVNPTSMVLHSNRDLHPDHRRVMWQATVDEPDKQSIPRGHKIWSGRDQSFDSEAEVRLHPQAKVRINGAYVFHGDEDMPAHGSATASPDPTRPHEVARGWKFHPMDHHADVTPGPTKERYKTDYPDLFGKAVAPAQDRAQRPQECNWGDHPATHSLRYEEGRHGYIPSCDEHAQKSRDAIKDMGETVQQVHRLGRRVEAVSVSWEHHDDDPSTWSEDYHSWAKEKPHAVAVSQAQEHVRRHVPTMSMDLGSGEDATNAMQHMLRKGGHPDHDEGFVMKHPNLGWGQSQAFTSDGQPGVALHPSKWDYGTLAHETAHHLHQHELGRKPHDDAEAHGPDFIRHYQSLLGEFGRGASDKLGEKYHESLGKIRGHASKSATKEPNQRLFGKTFGLDHRLFQGERLKSDVRRYILETLGKFWKPLHGYSWDEWAKVYFAGSEASEWTSESLEGNGDFDVLIGVDYDQFRANACRCHPAGSDEEITAQLNEELRRLDEKTSTVWIPVKSNEWRHQAGFNQSKLQMSSADTAAGIQPRGSRGSTASIPPRSVGTSNSPESLGTTAGARRRASNEGSSAPSVVVPGMSQRSLGVGPASPGTSGTDTSVFTTASRPSSSMNSSSSRAVDAPFVDGRTSSSWPTTTIGAAPAGARAGSASGASSAPDATKGSPTLVKPIFMPQSAMWTAESPPPAPEGWEYIGPFNGTFYVNKDSWDIRKIKPYAAYDVTDDRWAVRPPHLPDWDISQFPEGHALVQEAHAVAAYVRAVLALPEPYLSQQATALWEHLHSDRSRAFGVQGEGWYDPANVIEKWLDQLGLWQKLVDARMQARDHPEMLVTPSGWSNDPHSLTAGSR